MSNSSTTTDQRANDIQVSLVDQQSKQLIDEEQLIEAVEAVLRDSQFASSSVSVAVVDDTTIHELNRRYLDHDYPTDVLSFVLEDEDGHLEGEVIVSADTAAATAAELGCPMAAELLLYVVHGTLHLIGYRDSSTDDEQRMHTAEAKYLRQFGFTPQGRAKAAPRGANGL